MTAYKLLAVDLQNDFASQGGKHYRHRPSVDFLTSAVFPYLLDHDVKISEINSDYRQPRPGDEDESCVPGTWGYESIVPAQLTMVPIAVGSRTLQRSLWTKCMNAPSWDRKNIGDPYQIPGLPYPNPQAFTKWLGHQLGNPGEVRPVLFGLTLDCCLLCTAQELRFRGYEPFILEEGTDTYSGRSDDKEQVMRTVISNWAKVVTWDYLRPLLKSA